MASKSQEKYMVACAFAIGVAEQMEKHYRDQTGKDKVKKLINEMAWHGNKALLSAHGWITHKQLKDIESKVERMVKEGLEHAPSYQVYLAMVIGVISDRLAELPEDSTKVPYLKDLLESAEKLHRYFETRTRNENFDKKGFEILSVFDREFVEA